MTDLLEVLHKILVQNGLITAFALVGGLMWFSNFLSKAFTRGRLHGSALAVLTGLILAYAGGVLTGGSRGIADIELFAGIGLMGGAMLRDFTVIATAFGISLSEIRKTGVRGIASLLIGVFTAFAAGALVAYAFGYTDPVSMTTIGGGAATYVVGPVTGAAIGASSDVIAISIAAGLVKSILVMAVTPLVAPLIGLDNPRSAMIFGGLLGTTSGVSAGLAATDPKLVPYGAMTAAFYTALGCLLGPSVVFVVIRALAG
jgi:malonate transporter MadM subunit